MRQATKVSNFLSSFLKQIRERKKQILFAVICFFIFSFLLFPFDDLSDYLTAQVAQRSQNKVFLSFKNLGLQLLPPGVQMSAVTVDTAFMPQIKASRLSLAPSISGFLTFKPGFVAEADGLFGGDLYFSLKSGEKVNEDLRTQILDIDLSDFRTKDFGRFVQLPLEIIGTGRLILKGEVDPSFSKQPNGDYSLKLDSIKIPATTVPTMLGPINLPTIELKIVNFKGRLVNGEMVIEEATFGQAGEFVNGRLKGKINLKIYGAMGQIQPQWGAYDLKVDLNLNRDAESQFGGFLSIIDKYKTLTGTGARYALQLSGSSFQSMPDMKTLGAF